MTLYYPAIIRNKTSEGYRVDFLDLDDCYGVGPTEEEALADAMKKYVGPNPRILALPQTFKVGAVHLCMKDDDLSNV